MHYYGKALRQNPMTYKAINRGSILGQRNKSKAYYYSKAKNLNYFSLPNNALKLTAPSGHAFCYATDVGSLGPWAQKRAPRPAA